MDASMNHERNIHQMCVGVGEKENVQQGVKVLLRSLENERLSSGQRRATIRSRYVGVSDSEFGCAHARVRLNLKFAALRKSNARVERLNQCIETVDGGCRRQCDCFEPGIGRHVLYLLFPERPRFRLGTTFSPSCNL
jgi:hypothetical protein